MGGSARRASHRYAAVGGSSACPADSRSDRSSASASPCALSRFICRIRQAPESVPEEAGGPGGHRSRTDADPRHAPSHRARRPRTRLHQPQPGRRLRHHRRLRARSSARASTSAPAARTPRSTPCARPASAARGGTAYVTLEPCNHTGRTGPCAQALDRRRDHPRRLRRRRPEPAGHRRRRHPARRRDRRRRPACSPTRPRRATPPG